MATVSVKLRPSRVEGRAGVVCYQITHKRRMRQIRTSLHVLPAAWDEAQQRPIFNAVDGVKIRRRIESDVARIRALIARREELGYDFSAEEIVRDFTHAGEQVPVVEYMQQQIIQLRAAQRFGTACNYEKALRSFSRFLGPISLPLSAFGETVVAEYNAFLIGRGLVCNSVSFYMRILRAIYNKAVRQKLVLQPTRPFDGVYTGIDRTRKRAVSEEVVAELYRLKLPENSRLAFARDLFIFSYCTRGMAFVDMAYLKRSNRQNGSICYVRRKTGQLLSIKIEPTIRQIIDRHACTDTPYLFPILHATTARECYEEYRMALNEYNRLLKQLSALLSVECLLTSYTSRHSWATAARNHHVPISVISAGMGHTSEQTTQIYLALLENSIIDQANKSIIGGLKKGSARRL